MLRRSVVRSSGWLASYTAVLLAFWGSRLHNLLTLPLFLDEATHLTRAQAVWQGKPFDLLLTGKAFVPYLAALFDPFSAAPFIGRFVVVLIGLVGIASACALGRALYSREAGLLAGTLWLLCPYLFFFERMALVDTSLAACATLCAWFAVRMFRTGAVRDALFCGGLLAMCVFAKTTGLIFGVIPAGFALLLPVSATPHGSKKRLHQVILVYAVTALLLLGPLVYIVARSADVLGIGTLASADPSSLGKRLAANLPTAWTAFSTYFGLAFLLLLITASVFAVLLFPRRGLALAMLIVVPLGVLIVTATELYLRYLVIALPGLITLAAIGLVGGVQKLKQWLELTPQSWGTSLFGVLPWIALVLWAFPLALPFMGTTFSDPSLLDLPRSDRAEYITGWASGYGLRDAALALVTRAHDQAITVTGLVGSCQTISLYLPPSPTITLECPDIWDGTGLGLQEGYHSVMTRTQLTGSALVIWERHGPVGANVIPTPYTVLDTFQRPGFRAPVLLLEVHSAPSDSTSPDPVAAPQPAQPSWQRARGGH